MTTPLTLRRFFIRATILLLAFAVGGACGGTNSGAGGTAAAGANASPADSSSQVPDSVRALMDSVMAIADASRMGGNKDAKVWFIMMSDFQCPYCRRFHDDTYPRIKREYVDRGLVRIAYVNSLGASHVHARVTAEYALCAGLQGKFWEYHDALFRSFDVWTAHPAGTQYFDTLAAGLKLNTGDLQLCMTSRMMRRIVTADGARSDQAGVTGTPAFLIGGKLLVGAHPFDVFKRELDAALAVAGGTAKTPSSRGSEGRGGM